MKNTSGTEYSGCAEIVQKVQKNTTAKTAFVIHKIDKELFINFPENSSAGYQNIFNH